jgi:hypothetical protein
MGLVSPGSIPHAEVPLTAAVFSLMQSQERCLRSTPQPLSDGQPNRSMRALSRLGGLLTFPPLSWRLSNGRA